MAGPCLSGHIEHEELGYIVEPGYLAHWLGDRSFRLIK